MAIINTNTITYFTNQRQLTISGNLLNDDNSPIINEKVILSGTNLSTLTTDDSGNFSGTVNTEFTDADFNLLPVLIIYKPLSLPFVTRIIIPQPSRPIIDVLEKPIWSSANVVLIKGHVTLGLGTKFVHIVDKNKNVIYTSVDNNGNFEYTFNNINSAKLSCFLWALDIWGENLIAKKELFSMNFNYG